MIAARFLPGASPYFDLRSGLFVPSSPVDPPFGRIVRSARSRSCRAIAIGSPLSTRLAASRSTSCWAERISPSMMSIELELMRIHITSALL